MSAVIGEEQRSRSASSASTFSSSLPGDENLTGRLVDFTSRQCSALRTPPARKAKRIRFYRNGDRFYKGVMMAVTPERYRSFDSLVADLTRALVDNVNLPNGVRTLFTMDGQKVFDLEELEDGKCYVCSGLGETFKRVDYSSNSLQTGKLKHRKSLPSMHQPESTRSPTSRTNLSEVIRPRLITLIRNGTRPRKVVRLLLNKRNAPSLDHAFSSITDAVKLDSGAVRKVFTLSGLQVTKLEDFFGDSDVFFAYGNERYSKEDFDLDVEEYKAIQSQRKNFRNIPRLSCSITRSGQRLSGSQECVGDGNFAVVRQCIERSTGTEYALKIIDKSKCQGKEHMIESEVSILRRVHHPNIIQLIAEYDTHSELYLVMELVKGGDLFDAIASATKFTEKEASIMIRNLASALFYLHSLNIVHRDIKPENLLVQIDRHGNRLLKLGDFGLAQVVTEPLYTVCGTPTYVAPEILAESGYGLKIDVWAAGVILYILLCGFPPFVSSNNDQEELFDHILTGHYEFTSPYWDDISISAKDLIAHMLQVQPEFRFSAEDVLDHLWLAEAGGVEQLKVYRTTNYHISPQETFAHSSDFLLSVDMRIQNE
ncbi:Serine/threonine-protein kinase [Blattella germanica]|nr:Serine/threonine-protein kinase [Blattella germanica]